MATKHNGHRFIPNVDEKTPAEFVATVINTLKSLAPALKSEQALLADYPKQATALLDEMLAALKADPESITVEHLGRGEPSAVDILQYGYKGRNGQFYNIAVLQSNVDTLDHRVFSFDNNGKGWLTSHRRDHKTDHFVFSPAETPPIFFPKGQPQISFLDKAFVDDPQAAEELAKLNAKLDDVFRVLNQIKQDKPPAPLVRSTEPYPY